MQDAASKSDLPNKRPRWFGRSLAFGVRLVLLLLVALPLTWICLAGERTMLAINYVCILEPNPTFREERWEHGWPLVFLRREVINDSSSFYRMDEGHIALEWRNLAIDLLTLATVVVGLGYLLFWPAKSIAKRRDWSFSLKTGLIVLTIASVPVADFANAWRQSRHEMAVGAELERLGHAVQYDKFGPRWATRLFAANRRWVMFPGIDSVEMFEEAGDRDLDVALRAGLKDAIHLKEFYLGETRIGDEGLARFLAARRNWPIEKLSVSQTPISGAPFVGCHSLDRLEVLWANDSDFNDQAVAGVSKLPSVTFLNVSDCAVTAASLSDVQKMPRLREFSCFDTAITVAELDPLRQQGIECHPADYSKELNPFLPENPFDSTGVALQEDDPFGANPFD